MQAIIAWFPRETWVAMTMALTASGFDLILTLALVVVGRAATPFSWRRLPQFLVTNLLPLVLGALLGAVAVKAVPEFGTEYLTLIGAVTAFLHRGIRDKLKQLIGAPTDSVTNSFAPPSVTKSTIAR